MKDSFIELNFHAEGLIYIALYVHHLLYSYSIDIVLDLVCTLLIDYTSYNAGTRIGYLYFLDCGGNADSISDCSVERKYVGGPYDFPHDIVGVKCTSK